jgi:hypothetical protein
LKYALKNRPRFDGGVVFYQRQAAVHVPTLVDSQLAICGHVGRHMRLSSFGAQQGMLDVDRLQIENFYF